MEHCKICGNGISNRLHAAREMMFGFRDEFTYLECGNCGCLQLLQIPKDMAKYYPHNYYSFGAHNRFKTFLRHQWSAYAYRGGNPIGWLVWNLFGPYEPMMAIRKAEIPKDARILDVGCGSGQLLLDLRHLGFAHLAGLDPFIGRDLDYGNGVKVFKRQIAELQGEFDVIMAHHSFEHMDQPAEVIRHIARLLTPSGRVILRIPIASSFAWKHFGVNWLNMDPPRHFYLHTPRSIAFLTDPNGLAIDEIVYEGDAKQFLGSEQYQEDIPLMDPRSFSSGHITRWLNWRKNRALSAKAEELNRKKEGYLACFYLRKTKSTG